MNKLKIAVLDAATLGEDIDLSLFEELGDVTVYGTTPPNLTAERAAMADVCVINKVKMTAEVLEGAPDLRLICIAATGYDNIDTAYCRKHGIAVCNVPGYSANSVSQLTLAMVLAASVNLNAFTGATRDGTYTAGGVQNILTPVFHELAGKTWGIVGYGGIGRKVADGARALGCRVVACKRNPVDDVECLSLDEVLSVSDIISLHVPLSDATRGMIGERELSLMRDGAFLVNVARGAVTDEAAIVRALKSGKLGFFGCDVYSTEPFSEDHPFYGIREMDNVCLTPHMAWGAYEARARCMDEILQNIRSFMEGGNRNRVE